MSRLAHLLGNWLERQPEPRGQVLCGEAGCWLQRDPDSTVGIDVVYIDPEMAGRQTDDTTMLEGVPTLAVEILSPNDTQQEINEKVDTYLSAGVPLVWIVNVHDQTVLVHTPNTEPELFNVTRNVSADPHLPGFEIAVRSIFER